jgi:adenylate kinase
LNKQNVVIFLGPPGSGKGSLSNLAIKNMGFNQISTGNLCRHHIANATDIGKQIDVIIKDGKLISDELITSMVIDWLNQQFEVLKPIILDGYPRTVNQAIALNSFVDEKNYNLSVVRLRVADESLIQRVVSRIVCSNTSCQRVYSNAGGSEHGPKLTLACDDCSSVLIKRKDDTLDAVVKRLKVYREHETELINYFEKHQFNIIELAADRSLEDVYRNFAYSFGVINNDYNQKSTGN